MRKRVDPIARVRAMGTIERAGPLRHHIDESVTMVSVVLFFLLVAQIQSPFSDPAKTQLVPIPDDSAKRTERKLVIRKLIKDLNADQFKVRNAASEKLQELACEELELIKEAANSTTPEVAMRAKQIIEKFSSGYSHTVVDAVGNPIPNAKVVIERKSERLDLKSDGCGHLAVPGYTRSDFMRDRPTITVSHQDYGVALGDYFPGFPRFRPGEKPNMRLVDGMISIPLVNKSSPARKRAATGKVVREDGTPIADARVTCRIVRTPGMGLMQAGDVQTVMTNEAGEFSLYMDQRRCQNRALPSKLIPPNSRYHLQIKDSEGELFPWGGERTNLQTKPIVLQRPTREFNVRFLDVDGDEIIDEATLSWFSVNYRGSGHHCQLKGDYVKRGRLLPGTYSAIRRPIPGQRRAEMGPDKYVNVTINADSPDDVTFKVAQARKISGTVVDAETGEPMANAIVITLCSTSDKWLSMLTDEQWDLLEKQTSAFEDDALKVLREIFGRQMTATKSDAKGEFMISESFPGAMHSVVAFTRKHVPMRESLYCIDKNLKEEKGNPRFTLFPAASVTIPPNAKSRPYTRWDTDVNGEAMRMVDPNASGFCKVGGMFPGKRVPAADKLKVKFTVGEIAKETLVIEISQEQIEAILGTSPAE